MAPPPPRPGPPRPLGPREAEAQAWATTAAAGPLPWSPPAALQSPSQLPAHTLPRGRPSPAARRRYPQAPPPAAAGARPRRPCARSAPPRPAPRTALPPFLSLPASVPLRFLLCAPSSPALASSPWRGSLRRMAGRAVTAELLLGEGRRTRAGSFRAPPAPPAGPRGLPRGHEAEPQTPGPAHRALGGSPAAPPAAAPADSARSYAGLASPAPK